MNMVVNHSLGELRRSLKESGLFGYFSSPSAGLRSGCSIATGQGVACRRAAAEPPQGSCCKGVKVIQVANVREQLCASRRHIRAHEVLQGGQPRILPFITTKWDY